MKNIFEIDPIKAFVRSDVVREVNYGLEPCTIFGITTYVGEALTFVIELSGGEIFTYIPPTAISLTEINEDEFIYDLNDLVYDNCPSLPVSVNKLNYLNGELAVYMRGKDTWETGEYFATIDFYDDNQLFNLVKIDNFLAFVPFHKLKNKENIKENQFFDDNFKKQRLTYIV